MVVVLLFFCFFEAVVVEELVVPSRDAFFLFLDEVEVGVDGEELKEEGRF